MTLSLVCPCNKKTWHFVLAGRVLDPSSLSPLCSEYAITTQLILDSLVLLFENVLFLLVHYVHTTHSSFAGAIPLVDMHIAQPTFHDVMFFQGIPALLSFLKGRDRGLFDPGIYLLRYYLCASDEERSSRQNMFSSSFFLGREIFFSRRLQLKLVSPAIMDGQSCLLSALRCLFQRACPRHKNGALTLHDGSWKNKQTSMFFQHDTTWC